MIKKLLLFAFLLSCISTIKVVSAQTIDIKNCVVLVRLKTSKNKINALREIKRFNEADEVKAKQRKMNLEIIEAFKKEFDFCPVYFFYSNCSDEIINKNFKGCILNEKLLTDTSFNTIIKDFIIAEFDVTENFGIKGLLVKDCNFIQMKKPFPYLTRSFEMFFIKLKKEDVVRTLNNKIKLYAQSYR